MATVLVLDPSAEMRELYGRAISARGHAVVLDERVGPEDVDALVFEPASASALATARRLGTARPELPMICASIGPRRACGDDLAVAAYLAKPFRLAQLAAVIDEVLAPGDGAGPRR